MLRIALACLGLSLAALAGCDAASDLDPPPVSEPRIPKSKTSAAAPAASASAAAESAKPYATAPDAPGPAFMLVRYQGIDQLYDGEITQLEGRAAGGLQQGPDGTVYAFGSGLTHSILGGVVTRTTPVMTSAPTFDNKGTMTALKSPEIVTLDTTKDRPGWTSETVPDVEGALQHLVFDKDNNPVVASLNHVHTKKDGQWQRSEAKSFFKGATFASVEGLARVGDEVLVISGAGVATLDGTSVKLPFQLAFRMSTSSPQTKSRLDGTLEITSQIGLITISKDLKATGKRASVVPKATQLFAFTVDGQNRYWLSTDAGVTVLSEDNKVLMHLEPGVLRGQVEDLLVVGAGPTLPEVAPKAPTISITGTYLFNGEPLPNAEVVGCANPAMVMTGTHPCSNQPYVIEGKTDDTGAFAFKDVPRATYGLAAKTPKGWFLNSGSNGCCETLKPGSSKDLGQLKIQKK